MSAVDMRTVADQQALDLSGVDEIVAQIGRAPEAVIPILQAIQQRYRYLHQDVLRRVCEITEITPAQIAGVSTFYTQFRHQPVGRHVISACHGTACHVKGAEFVTGALRRRLRLREGQDTDAEGLFTVQQVACLGCCTLAPVMQIDGVTYGHLTPSSVDQVLRDFLELQARRLPSPSREPVAEGTDGLAEIRIGIGSCCVAGGSQEVRTALEGAVRQLQAPAVVKPVGCVGVCHRTPLLEIVILGQEPVLYANVLPGDAEPIIRRHFPPRRVAPRLQVALLGLLDRLQTEDPWEPVTRYALDTRDGPVCAFLGPQMQIATEYRGCIDPLDLQEYLSFGGFEGLRHALIGQTPEQAIQTVTHSGLRGRGGAGYLTGTKWSQVRAAHGEPKYIVCNGDEGDPGAFMDRMLLESYPFRVLEGMAIAAYAIGAREGILYIRAEYPLAVRRVWHAIRACEGRGLLGRNILGTDFSLYLNIREGAGAFVCGEETALLASIEGRRGMPRYRPPYPAEKGLWGKPTLVSNVETYACLPWILRHGSAAFAAIGTQFSKGTKVFALAGKVARGGLIEVPMGTTLRQIVEEIGGGVPEGRWKAVQVGGPSGGCVPAELADTPVDYQALSEVGAIMGSGGMVVIDDRDCMVDIARYFLQFTQRESCGKCTFCRIGTRQMLDILERICTGEGHAGDLQKLEELSVMVKRASLCGLGQTAPNPVLSTLRHFRDEYEAHLAGRCPAGKCKALITYHITDQCIGCTKCAQQCPSGAIPLTPFETHTINTDTCIRCGTCRTVCPVDAVEVR